MADQPDYVKTYDEFWKDIVENPDGTLNRDQIMRELHDYHGVMDEVSMAYDAVTFGRISKPNTAHYHVEDAVNERIEAACTDAAREAREQIADWIRSIINEGELGHQALREWMDGHPTMIGSSPVSVLKYIADDIALGKDQRTPAGS